jgi:hypothetical protein
MISTLARTLLARHRRWWLLTPALTLPLWCGCGTQAYDEQMQKTMASLKLRGKFVDLVPTPYIVVDPGKGLPVNVSIRLPTAFAGTKALNESSADPNFPQDPIPHDRVQPPFMDIPGYQITYEQFVSSASGVRVMSMYFGVTPADRGILDKIPGDLKAKLQLPNDLFWKTEPVIRPDGSTSPWKSITIQAPQGFYWTNSGRSTPETLDGTFGLWVHEDPKYYVFIGYRFPTSSAALAPMAKGLAEALTNAAGTVQITPAAPPPPKPQ